MTQTALVLFVGWLCGAIAVAMIPGRSERWKLTAIVVLLGAFCIEEQSCIGTLFLSEVKQARLCAGL